MTTTDRLAATLALIETRSSWCKEALATDRDGAIVDPRATEAKQWCATGALEKVLTDRGEMHYWGPCYIALVRATWGMGYSKKTIGPDGRAQDVYKMPQEINDDEGHAAAVKMIREAIKLLEKAK